MLQLFIVIILICCKKIAMNIYVIGIYYEYKCHWYDGSCYIMKYIIWYREDGHVWLIVISGGMSKIFVVCRILFYSSAGMSNFILFFCYIYIWCQHTNDMFNINIISLVCWHDFVVLVWNIYLMLSWRWICFVYFHKWWYVEIFMECWQFFILLLYLYIPIIFSC